MVKNVKKESVHVPVCRKYVIGLSIRLKHVKSPSTPKQVLIGQKCRRERSFKSSY
jgi:hypothetical protein